MNLLDLLVKFLNWLLPKAPPGVPEKPLPVVLPKPPPPPEPAPIPVETISAANFQTQKGAYHATRVIADHLGLTLEQKNLLCACIFQESRFLNGARNQNKKNGAVWSTDFGIVQCNDYFHIGKGKDFPSVDYVLSNPDAMVKWMGGILKRTGKLQPWSSYTSGAYLPWLKPSSPMWGLAG